jgi:hypothetical protein
VDLSALLIAMPSVKKSRSRSACFQLQALRPLPMIGSLEPNQNRWKSTRVWLSLFLKRFSRATTAPFLRKIFQLTELPVLNILFCSYGQTGTGKTYTMEGDFSDNLGICWDKDPDIGIIPRSMGHLFHRLNDMVGYLITS